MQISSVNYKDLNPEFRIDAEYYRAEILNRLNILENHNKDTLNNLVDFVVGPLDDGRPLRDPCPMPYQAQAGRIRYGLLFCYSNII